MSVKQLALDQVRSFEQHGYLILRDILTPSETQDLQKWATEVHSWPNDHSTQWMPYEEVQADGKRVLCRTENYADYHSGLNELLRGPRLLTILNQLAGEDMLLFKEKINYKLAGSGGFAPHIDATAYTHVKDIGHLTILLAVDESNMTNGGLEVVDASHAMSVPLGSDNCIAPEWVKEQMWVPVELEPGNLLIFGSYLAHRSGPNESSSDRKNLYATYNRASEGDLRAEYYANRREKYPATHMRKKDADYSEGELRYGFGSPMMSAHLGKQIIF